MIGVLFATQREAEPLLARLDARALDAGPFPCWSFSTPQGVQGVVGVCGMGKEAAARGVEHLVAVLGTTEILNPGICGATVDDVEVGGLYRIVEVRDGDDPGGPTWACEPGNWSDLPPARLTTCDEPVFDPGRRDEIAAWGQLVDMEGMAVARACSEHAVPCTLLKGVSDLANAGGREDLHRNIDAVSSAVAAAVQGGLQ